jgi:endo-1,4-beta-D-glucanase Y
VYKYGIMPKSIDNTKVQKAFDDFMKLYKEEGDLARICYDNTSFTVSEGIGYGMLVMVYMDNATNNTQPKFDKIWNYYKKFLNQNGLMHWKINGFSTIDQRNAATDAELDVAIALLQAYKQWGNEQYLTDAKSMIDKISKFEVNANGYLKPGDTWDNKKNPSYFSTGALECYKQASSFDWGKVITNSYTLLKKVQNSTTGLVPDWCGEGGDAQGDYFYDATRTPWRIAWAHSWYGHADAKAFCTKIASWIATKTNGDPANIKAGYKLDGSQLADYGNATFVGPFACAGMVDATHQEWLDKSFTYLAGMAETVYFQVSLKMLTMLYLSGNMPNLWDNPTSARISPRPAPPAADRFSVQVPQAGSLRCSFTTAVPGRVSVALYAPDGKVAARIVDGVLVAGDHSVTCHRQLAGGIYVAQMRSADGTLTREAVIVNR